MAQVKIIQEQPTPPPVKEVVVTLSHREAVGLSNLLSSGVLIGTLNSLGLTELQRQISKVPYGKVERVQFGSVASDW